MFSRPVTYHNLPHFSYDPRLQSSYYRKTPVQSLWSVAQEQAAAERARAMAKRGARWRQYLPDEDVDSEDEWEDNRFGIRERAYLDARTQREILQRRLMQEEAVRQRALAEKRWQDSLDHRKKEGELNRGQIMEERGRLQRKEEDETTANERGHEQPRSRERSTSHLVPVSSSEGNTSVKLQSAIPKPGYQEGHHRAASTIQKHYRVHQSIRAIDSLKREFELLKRQFSFPEKLDFQQPGSEEITTISVNANDDTEPYLMVLEGDDASKVKLAFTSTNFALNQYTDLLDKMLVKLDGVESWGNKKVREKRRGVVKEIEEEAENLERYWKQRWWRYKAEQT